MATADALDRGVSGGLVLLKQRMKEMASEIKAFECKQQTAIKARDEARSRYRQCQQQLKNLKDTILEKEEENRKKEEKYKQLFCKLDEKQEYIIRARMFNKGIETVEPEKIKILEEKVREVRSVYFQRKKKYQAAQDKLIDLEQRVEFKENKVKDAERRVSEYNVSLEYRQKEYDIKRKRYNQAVSGNDGAEEKLTMTEQLLTNATTRLSIATRNVTALEARIAAAEDALGKYRSQRLSMESTLRELLSSAVNMNKKKEGQPNGDIRRVNAMH